MLVYKGQVVSVVLDEPKPWEMNGKSGVTHSAKLAIVGTRGDVASITLKAKTAEELKAKMNLYPAGKPAEVQIADVRPMFQPGERKASGYQFTG